MSSTADLPNTGNGNYCLLWVSKFLPWQILLPFESSEIVPNKEEETILEDPEKDKGKGKARATVVPNPRFLLEQVCRAKPGCFPKGGPATRALLLK